VDPLAQRLGKVLFELSTQPNKPPLLKPSLNPVEFWRALDTFLAVEKGIDPMYIAAEDEEDPAIREIHKLASRRR